MKLLTVIEARGKTLSGLFLEHSVDLCGQCAARIHETLPEATVVVITESPEHAFALSRKYPEITCLRAAEYWTDNTSFLRVAASEALAAYRATHDLILVVPEAVAEHVSESASAMLDLLHSTDTTLVVGVEEMRDNPCQFKSHRTLLDINLFLPRELDAAVFDAFGVDPAHHYLSVPVSSTDTWNTNRAQHAPGVRTINDPENSGFRIVLDCAQDHMLTTAKALSFDANLTPCAAAFEQDSGDDFIVHFKTTAKPGTALRLILEGQTESLDFASEIRLEKRGEQTGFVMPCSWRNGTPVPYILSDVADDAQIDFTEHVSIPGKCETGRYSRQIRNLENNSAVHGRQAYPDLYTLNDCLALFEAKDSPSLGQVLANGQSSGFVVPPSDSLMALLDRNDDTDTDQRQSAPTVRSPLDMVFEQAQSSFKDWQAPQLFNLLKKRRNGQRQVDRRSATHLQATHQEFFGRTHLQKPVSAAITSAGDILVSDIIENTVVTFDADYTFKAEQKLDARALFTFLTDTSGQRWLSDVVTGQLFHLSPAGEVIGSISLPQLLGQDFRFTNVLSGCVHGSRLYMLLGAKNPLDQVVATLDLEHGNAPCIIDTSCVRRGNTLISYDNQLLLSGFDSSTIYTLEESTDRFAVWRNDLPLNVRDMLVVKDSLLFSSTHEVWALEPDGNIGLLIDARKAPQNSNAAISQIVAQDTDHLLYVDKNLKQVASYALTSTAEGGAQ